MKPPLCAFRRGRDGPFKRDLITSRGIKPPTGPGSRYGSGTNLPPATRIRRTERPASLPLIATRDERSLRKHAGPAPGCSGRKNEDGGWGGTRGVVSSVEETALAVEALLSIDSSDQSAWRGMGRLLDWIDDDSFSAAAPIGFYFAKLWYFEALYPHIFVAAALRCADQLTKLPSRNASCPRRQNPGIPSATPPLSH